MWHVVTLAMLVRMTVPDTDRKWPTSLDLGMVCRVSSGHTGRPGNQWRVSEDPVKETSRRETSETRNENRDLSFMIGFWENIFLDQTSPEWRQGAGTSTGTTQTTQTHSPVEESRFQSGPPRGLWPVIRAWRLCLIFHSSPLHPWGESFNSSTAFLCNTASKTSRTSLGKELKKSPTWKQKELTRTGPE